MQRFPANFDALSDALAFVSRAGADAGFTPDQCRRIELVIEELFTNTVDYGYPASSLPESERMVRLAARALPSGLELVYEDCAPAFDPTVLSAGDVQQRVSEREIGGLGRLLIMSLPGTACYERRDDRNRIILRFDRWPRPSGARTDKSR